MPLKAYNALTMADLKLFEFDKGIALGKKPVSFSLEKEIQTLCERNLKTFFGIEFLATEYVTGHKHNGRIDTLGLDENKSPVILEYKLSSNDNVINQGLYYLDWLMDHKAEFEMLCLEKFGEKVEVDWTNPRLVCVANDFTKYDDYAIAQIRRNINLIRYRIFDDNHIIFELSSSIFSEAKFENTNNGQLHVYKGIEDHEKKASENLKKLMQEVEDYILSLGDDVQKKELKHYYAFTRIKNFVCMEIRPQSEKIILYLKLPYSEVPVKSENITDVSGVGHYGTGDTKVIITSSHELEIAKELIFKSYEIS